MARRTALNRFTDDPRRTADRHYLGRDPMAGVSGSILEFVKSRAGHRVVDLGCGTGGYALMLQRAGFEVTALDSNPEHVAAAGSLGVPAFQVDGSLPFSDHSVDTLVMIEVLEHVPDEEIESLLEEIRRVVRTNVLLTVPDCEDVPTLQKAGVTCEHFLAADHVQFFTARSLSALVGKFFPKVEIIRGDPVMPHLLLPATVRRPLSALYRLGFLRPSLYSRLFVEARIDG
jgi:SAM-dependent methyltransferase